MQYSVMSGAGNRFAVVDGFTTPLPDDPRAMARAVCASLGDGGHAPRLDGLLLLRDAAGGADCAMEVYNADGSRPETCGNGLRCVAKLFADRHHVDGDRFVIATDAGPCDTRVERSNGLVHRARIYMGKPRITARDETIDVAGTLHTATLVDIGNPHCILVVDDERTAPVTTLGPAIERHARFPHGTNVEFLALRDGAAHLRVWERGVGETQACGSGACATAAAANASGLLAWPIRLHLPGGLLEVDSDGKGGVYLTGPVELNGTAEWPASSAARDDASSRRDPHAREASTESSKPRRAR